MNVFIFPGQGSQFLEMKKYIDPDDLFFAQNFLNFNLEEAFSSHQINQTEYSQLLIFLHSVSVLKNIPLNFDLALGHSLGEYSALYACGVWSFETTLKIIRERSKLMASCKKGSMWVFLTKEDLTSLSEQLKNNNSLDQWIFSGLEEDFLSLKEKVLQIFPEVKVIPLKVSGAFHSKYMKEISNEFKIFLEQQEFLSLKKPFISNVTAQIIKEIDKKDLIDLLTRQLSESVLWRQSLALLKENDEVYEIGPGKILTGLMKKNRPEIKVSSFQSREDYLSLSFL